MPLGMREIGERRVPRSFFAGLRLGRHDARSYGLEPQPGLNTGRAFAMKVAVIGRPSAAVDGCAH